MMVEAVHVLLSLAGLEVLQVHLSDRNAEMVLKKVLKHVMTEI